MENFKTHIYVCECVCVYTYTRVCAWTQSLSCVQLLATQWTVAHHGPCPWDFSDINTGVGHHFCRQGIFPTQGQNLCLLCLLHCRRIIYLLNHQGSPYIYICIYNQVIVLYS